MERRLENFPFLQYAAKWWGWHLQKTRSLHLQEMALMLLKNHRSSMSISQASHLPSFRFHNYSQLYPKNVNALHVAAQFGLDEFAKSVFADGNADLDSEDSLGWTALHRAAENGHVGIVRLLLEKGCNPNVSARFGGTLLHRAAKNGHLEVAQLLIHHKVKLDAEDNYGGTPLHRAARNGHLDIAKALLSFGACVNRNYNFHVASRLIWEDSLVQAVFASPEFRRHPSRWDMATQDKVAARLQAELTASGPLLGGTALHEAAGSGYEELVRWLLDLGHAEIDAEDYGGGTALHRAARNGHGSVVSILLERGALVHRFCDYTALAQGQISLPRHSEFESMPGEFAALWKVAGTPLQDAARNGHENVVHLLLSNGVDPNLASVYGARPLNGAARNGHAAVIQALLQHGADVDQSNNIGGAPIHEAAEYGRETAALLLLKAGANVNKQRADGSTPLVLAAKGGHEALVGLLLSWGAEADMVNRDDHTALSIAAENGHTSVVQLLLRHGANFDFVATSNGTTPLFLAVQNGHSEVAKILLQHGADPNFVCHRVDRRYSVLAVAVELANLQTVEELLSNGADPTSVLYWAIAMISCPAHEKIVCSLLRSGADVCARLEWWPRNTALHAAVEGGHERMAALLIAHGADINATNGAEETPLHHAAKSRRVSMVQLLLRAGARHEVGVSPLYAAAQSGSEAAAQILLDHGAEIMGNSNGGTARQEALLVAARRGVTTLVQVLLDCGEDVDLMLEDKTPLINASKGGHVAVIRLLAERGAQLEKAETRTGMTPIMLAVSEGHEPAALLLLQLGARLDAVDKMAGRSLLSWASEQGMDELVRELLGRDDIDVDAKDCEDRTPISLAAEQGHATIVQFLRRNGAEVDSVGAGLTPLGFASEAGQPDVVRLLAAAGANINAVQDSLHPIELAAKGGHTAVVREFVDLGANDSVGRQH
jgi:ankyrin repeat protein